MSIQRSGIRFNRGKNKKLEMDFSAIPSFSGDAHKAQKKSTTLKFGAMKQILIEVDRCVDEHMNKMFGEEIEQIATFLSNQSVDQQLDNLFNTRSEQAIYRAAVVTCNFADTEQVMKMCRQALFTEKKRHIITVDHQSPANILDQINAMESTQNCVLVIRQAETLPHLLLSQILSLLRSVPIDAMVSFLICVSTTPAFLASTCSLRALQQLDPKIFHLETSDESNRALIEKMLNLNYGNTIEGIPIQLGGQLVADAFQRYACEHKSIILLKNSIKFAVVRHFLEKTENPAQLKHFKVFVDKYRNACQLFAKLTNQSESRVHANVQVYGEEFLTHDDLDYVRRWRVGLLNASNTDLTALANNIMQLLKQSSSMEQQTAMIEEITSRFEDQISLSSPQKPSIHKEETPQKTRKSVSTPMKFTQLRQQNQEAIRERANNPLITTKQELCSIIIDFFKNNLIPWEQDVSAKYSVITQTDDQLSSFSNARKDMEKTLGLMHNPISTALQVLLSNENQAKNIRFGEWARTINKEIDLDSEVTTSTSLYAIAAHLEYIGILKMGTDKQFPSVNLNFVPYY